MATLGELITRVRQRADQENSAFVTDTEITGLLNLAYKELYGLLVRHSLQRTESTQTITANGSAVYALNSDFYSLINAFRDDGDVNTVLSRYPERHLPGGVTGTATHYRLADSGVKFYPQPASGTYYLLYIPVPADLSLSTDTVDGVLGWEEYMVLDVAIKILDKEESDTGRLERARAELRDRITQEANAVEFSETHVIQDSRRGRSSNYLEGDYVGRTGLRGWRFWW